MLIAHWCHVPRIQAVAQFIGAGKRKAALQRLEALFPATGDSAVVLDEETVRV
jgi:hypothetical protein